MVRLRLLLLAASMLVACKPPVVEPLPEANVRVSQVRVDFPATYVGFESSYVVTFSNVGGTTAEVTVNVAPPFLAEPSSFPLSRGADQQVTLTFAPTSVGSATTQTNGIELHGEGLAVPECREDTACTTSRFDGEQCVDEHRSDGTTCETNCIVGQCNAGSCSGALKGCPTNDVCLLPTCDETTGCGSTPRVCPEPTSPCQVATCDSVAGCGFVDALDGTLCGDDDCFASQVNVCVTGQCVLRPRPVTARCSNRWVPNTFPARGGFSMTWDAARGRTVVFGGQGFDDTWLWNGTTWEQRLPVSAPSRRWRHGTTWDPVRKRVLLFGGMHGAALSNETWEWDGNTWLRRTPATSPPPARAGKALAWDRVRHRAVLFLGTQGTWEWDGLNWSQRATSGGPLGEQPAISWDGFAKRVVLFGGLSSLGQRSNTVWEWDGTQWTARSPTTVAPSPRYAASLTWDSQRSRLLLVGGVDNVPLNDTWEWDGVQWLERMPTMPVQTSASAELTYDEARRRAVLQTGLDDGVWEWDGTDWKLLAKTRPPYLRGPALATDSLRNRVVLFGGNDVSSVDTNQTWVWNGVDWARLQPATSPTPRAGHAMTYDALRDRVVLFAGTKNGIPPESLEDTWEFDGTTWLQRTPSVSPPPRSQHVLVWDAIQQRTLLFGASNRNDTWTWDGTSWLEQQPMVSPPATNSALAWDGVQQRALLVSSATWSWDGADWRVHQTSAPQRVGFAMASDVARNRVIYVVRAPVFADPLETWEWNGATWTQLQLTTPLPRGVSMLLTWDPARQRVMALLDGTVWHFLP